MIALLCRLYVLSVTMPFRRGVDLRGFSWLVWGALIAIPLLIAGIVVAIARILA